MVAPEPSNPNRVVVACLDGRRLKGHVYNFALGKESFRLFPLEDPSQHDGIELKIKDLKAVFFVKDFAGHPERHDAVETHAHGHGRTIEVTFQDGERIVGTTEAFNPARIGFFLFPLDQGGNSTRVFVVSRNAKQVKALGAAVAS